MNAMYKYLEKIQSPKVIAVAVGYLGTNEAKGPVNNPVIMRWAQDLGLKQYTADSIAWCGLFVARVVSKAGFEPVKDPLWARNWAKWGTGEKVAMLGDVLVFVREGGGHVGFYVAEDKDFYHVLGGNQSDSVTITRIAKSRCIGIRRCPWKIAQPENVKRYIVEASGKISTNEA